MTSDVHLSVLSRARIASPCDTRWEDMVGDDRKRLCDDCGLHVHNVAAMTRSEAEELLAKAGSERVCARLWRRADGTIITSDCPVGLAWAKERVRRAAGRVAAAMGLVIGAGVGASSAESPRWAAWGWSMRLRQVQPFRAVAEWITPPPGASPGMVVMGEWCPPTPLDDAPTGQGESPFGPRME